MNWLLPAVLSTTLALMLDALDREAQSFRTVESDVAGQVLK